MNLAVPGWVIGNVFFITVFTENHHYKGRKISVEFRVTGLEGTVVQEIGTRDTVLVCFDPYSATPRCNYGQIKEWPVYVSPW